MLEFNLYINLEKTDILIILSLEIHEHGVCMLSWFSRVQLFKTLWTVALQARLFMGFSRQEY